MASTLKEDLKQLNSGAELERVNTAQSAQVIEPPKPVKQGSKVLPKVVVSAAAIGLAVGGFMLYQHAQTIEETDDAYVTGHVHQISARVSGYVTKVNVDDNDHVKAGQLIVQIDPTDYQLSAQSAKAAAEKASWQATEAKSNIVMNTRQADSQAFQAVSAIASAQAQIHRAQESLTDAQLGVMVSKTSIEQRQAELTRAIADYNRYKNLVSDRAVTTQSYDKAAQDKSVAQANLDAAKATYDQMLIKVNEAKQALLDTKTTAIRARGTQESAKAAVAQTDASKSTVLVEQAAKNQADVEYKTP